MIGGGQLCFGRVLDVVAVEGVGVPVEPIPSGRNQQGREREEVEKGAHNFGREGVLTFRGR